MIIPTDKLLHFLVCYILALTIGLFTNWWIGLLAAIVIGGLKELYDYLSKKGSPEWFDFLADCMGAVLGSMVVLLVQILL